jgi:hypothetical protein
MENADLISSIRTMRKLVSTLDSLGMPLKELRKDEDLGKLVPKTLFDRTIKISGDIHRVLQRIEGSKKYKNAVKTLLGKEIRDGGEY